ncbi:competence/damage-inducible protein A [Oceanobacillus halotolerans]|uniref:competence/damage-inducible protein A n=1 Tax=Oceanobacillus halotolerans TaxID=2663380 RepID=UPI0013DD00BF|nr:competence/damage-inducible protein A [Oceanobacillus halotolerans]
MNIRTEIIAVGTELLLGQIANTNAQWISQQLALNGMSVYYHGVVGDNIDRVSEAFNQAQKRSNIVIVTGGLGPTEDDLTREAFQLLTNMEIIEHESSINKIKKYFQQQQMKMTPNNRKQAHVFKQAKILDNHVGMAPGMIVEYEDTKWIFLPGVPREMKAMVSEEVIPYLQQTTGVKQIIQSTMLKFIGIGESVLEDEIHDLIVNQTNPTIAPLALNEGVAIRLTAKADTTEFANQLIEQMKTEILNRVGDYFYGVDEDTLASKVITLLKKHNHSIGAAESLTGGMFTDEMIAIPGASTVCRGGLVCYQPLVKQNVLGVSPETITNYGTVSEQCASEMATKICDMMDADIGISFTGVAGPNEEEGKPIGTVFIGIHDKSGNSIVRQFQLPGDRQEIRRKTILKGYELLFQHLK